MTALIKNLILQIICLSQLVLMENQKLNIKQNQKKIMQDPSFCLFDINKLEASMRKYATYFRIEEENIQILKTKIVEHFKCDLNVDNESTITEFLNVKKSQVERQLKRQRNGRNNNNTHGVRTPSTQKSFNH